jgi:alanine racemase
MFQAEIIVDLDAIRANTALIKRGTPAEVMAVVKADGYGHGMLESARAALAGGATWLGTATLSEAVALRSAGFEVPILAWLWNAGAPLSSVVAGDIQLGVSTLAQLASVTAAARESGRTLGTHLKIDTGLSRNGAAAADWPVLVEAAAKAQTDGFVEVVGAWSHFANADVPGHPSIDTQLAAFADGLALASRFGIEPRVRHMANSAAALTRPDSHFDLVRAGIALYGLSPIDESSFGLRPAMTARAKVLISKAIPEGSGVSYGHTYVTSSPSTVVLVPLGYADGVPRHASNAGPVLINGQRFTVSGRVCMDQFVVDVGSAEVHEGDFVTLFGPGDHGEPTADDWARAAGTINYEIVTRFGSSRVSRTYV